MREEEKDGLRERVAQWLDAFEIIQEAAQQRGLAVQDAKELAKEWAAILMLPLSSNRAWEQRAAQRERVHEDEDKRREEIVRRQQEVLQRAYEQRGVPAVPATIVWTVSSLPQPSGNSCASSGVSIAPYPYPQGKED